MTKQRSFKRSLAKSILSVTLCAGMLVGSTYAWFSDTATAGETTITAGNLDVEIKAENGTSDFTYLFGTGETIEDIEPGVMFASNPFTVVNNGSLALTYQLSIKGTKTAESDKDLTKVLKTKIVTKAAYDKAKSEAGITGDDASYDNRKTLWDSLNEEDKDLSVGVIVPKDSVTEADSGQKISKEKTEALVAVLFWEANDDEVDNEYNSESKAQYSAKFTLDVFATQTPDEKDSFGTKYDENAIAQRVVEQAVENGLASAQDAINAAFAADETLKDLGLEDSITVSPLEYNSEINAYETNFDFKQKIKEKGKQLEALTAGFKAMQDLIAEALFAQKTNVSAVNIGDASVDLEVDSPENLAQNLYNALQEGFSSMLGDLQQTGKITIPVTVTDIGGTTVNYNLNFDLTKVLVG